ncbi:MAG: glycosyltransferase [Solirubrobacteraceae bacterium]|jgi:glycosyltransferase involved in cell wall biosynthesis
MSDATVRLTPLTATQEPTLRELVVCSLEAWDDVWRRNQFFADALLRRNPLLRILFVEPPADVLFDLVKGRRPAMPRVRQLRTDGSLVALRPFKPLPRRLGSLSDAVLLASVLRVARRLGFASPTLWLNDVTYAPLIERTGWPTVYDVTDDWLLAPVAKREITRLRRLDELALNQAHQVVVCSPALAASRGAQRSVQVVPNGVDAEHFRRPRPRPHDLPPAPVAVYLGTLNEARLDVDLIVELARARPDLAVALVGPDALAAASRRALRAQPNVHLLGARPYADVPAYLQHADVVLVPHRVTPFTDSLDPIKAYESVAVGTATVATAVEGFRELSGQIQVVPREAFIAAVGVALSSPPSRSRQAAEPASWDQRARAFEDVLESARAAADEVGGD